MADNRKYVQGKDYALSGSGCTSSATSITLTSFKLPDGATNITTTDIGAKAYAVFEPETSREENFSFTTITQNSDGTATISGITRGLSFVSPYTNVAAYQLAHAGGTTVRISNSTPFYDDFANKNNDETIAQTWTYTNPNVPRMDSQVTYGAGTEEYFATKRYADSLAIAGAPNMSTTQKGIAEAPTQAEMDARTTTGGTGALLAVTPDVVRSVLTSDYAADAGATDAYAITVTPAITAYTTGQVFVFKANTANTGAATLNVNTLGAKTIKKNGNTDLETGDILAAEIITVVYDGTNMQLQGISPAFASTTVAGTTEEATLAEVLARTAAGGTGARLFINPSTAGFFGGSGTDGALTVAAGTTNINLDTIWNYTTVTISGGATLSTTQTDGCMYIKTTGAFTNAGTISLSGKGEAGGAASSTASGANSVFAGNAGTSIQNIPFPQDNIFSYTSASVGTHLLLRSGGRGGGALHAAAAAFAQGGAGGASLINNSTGPTGVSTGGGAGSAFDVQNPEEGNTIAIAIGSRAPFSLGVGTPTFAWLFGGWLPFATGAGGGGGSASADAGPATACIGGAGGRGGAGFYAEVRGDWNGTGGTVNLSGANGSNGSRGATDAAEAAGGGGGGGSGCGVVLSASVTAQGTLTVTGGTAGTAVAGASGTGTDGTNGAAGAITFITNTKYF